MSIGDSIDQDVCPPSLRNIGFDPVKQGTVLSREGEDIHAVHYIVRGLVKQVVNTEDGRELIVNLRSSGVLIGASNALSGSKHGATTTVLRESLICSVHVDVFRRLHASDGICTQWVSRLLSSELQSSLDHQLLLRTPSARGRVQRFFEWFAENVDCGSAGLARMLTPLKQVEIAQFLDITPEHYNRILRQLELEGLIQRNRSEVHLLDRVCYA